MQGAVDSDNCKVKEKVGGNLGESLHIQYRTMLLETDLVGNWSAKKNAVNSAKGNMYIVKIG
jgi:hypothetical protein